jgi:galactitol-specific phosphotransferase system IIB component
MKPITILCICGSGVAGANIIMYKLRTAFEETDIPVQLITAGISQTSHMVGSGQADMIVSTSMMTEYEGVPYFQAIPFYTGEGEQELLQEIIAAAQVIRDAQDQEES